MAAYLRQASRRANVFGAGIISVLALVAAWAGVQLAGTKTGALLTLGAVLGPIILVVAITAPAIFPFGFFAMLVPFDSLLALNGGTGGTLTAVLGAASAAALLFYGIRNKRFADPDRSVGVWTLYMFWIIASIFWAMDGNTAMALLPTAIELFAVYAVVSMIRITPRELSAILKLTAVGGVLAGLYLVYLSHTGVAIHEDRMYLRADGYYWNPDFLATALILPLMICITGAISSRGLLMRVGSVLGALMIMSSVVMTGARGPEVAIVLAVAYLVVRDKNRWKLIGVFGVLAAVAAIFYGPNLAVRWQEAMTDDGAGRTDIWKVAWVAFKHNWLFGTGFNNFQVAYNQVFIQVFQPLDIGWNHASHNIVVGNAVELGVIGLGIMLLGWWTQFRAVRHVDETDARYPVRLCLEASLIGLFVAGLTADIMLVKCSWLAFMLVNLTRNTVPVQRTAAAPALRTAPNNA